MSTPNEPDRSDSHGLTRRDRVILYAVLLVALGLVVALIAAFWQPAPPRRVVMSTGPQDGAYHAIARQYQTILARSGVELVLLPSTGAPQNLERLRSGKDGVTVALVQGGLVQAGDEERLVSLGAMFYEPVWLFSRAGLELDQFKSMAGKRVAAGVDGSGTQQVVRMLLERHGLAEMNPPLVGVGGLAAAQALQAGELDVAVFVAAAEAPAVQQLLRAPGITLWSARRAEAFSRQFPALSVLSIPEGAVDLGRNIPDHEVRMIALKANLLARRDIHPVLVDLLLDAAREVHGGGSILRRPGEFPAADSGEYTLADDAERFYKSGPSALRRYLPYWTVVWIQRLIFLGLPILAVGIPLARLLPGAYRWSMRRRIYRWYGELSFIEQAVRRGQGDRAAQLRRLEAIESRINAMKLPLAYASEAYTLRAHVLMVRDLLLHPGDSSQREARTAAAAGRRDA